MRAFETVLLLLRRALRRTRTSTGLLALCLAAALLALAWRPACQQQQRRPPRLRLRLQQAPAGDTRQEKEKEEAREVAGAEAGRCGTWQREYAALHERICSGSSGAQPRFLVSVAVEAGAADRIAGTITAFYWALLSGRALQLATYGRLPGFEAAFERLAVDWVRPGPPLPEPLLAPLKYTYRGQRDYKGERALPEEAAGEHAMLYLINNSTGTEELFGRGDVRTLPPDGGADAGTVLFASNRGASVFLTHNPHHSAALRAAGLAPETAFGCAYRFLFAERPEVLALYARELGLLQHRPPTELVGINIRVGDAVFEAEGEGRVALEDYRAYFACAEEIEEWAAAALPGGGGGRPFLWYLTSDSLALRQAAAAAFGPDRLVTDTATRLTHPDCEHPDPGRPGCSDVGAAELALRHAAGQLHAFSKAAYHVVPADSGFGAVGSMLGAADHDVMTWSLGQGGPRRRCTPEAADGLDFRAHNWAGI